MTTIAFRDGVLAADTGIFDRGCYVGSVVKIWRGPDGVLAGAAGCMGDCLAFRDWVMAGISDEPPKFKDADSEGILFHRDGRVEWFSTESRRILIDGPYHVIGSGFRIAMGALAAGANAEDAIQICCDLDNSTRGPITVLQLGA